MLMSLESLKIEASRVIPGNELQEFTQDLLFSMLKPHPWRTEHVLSTRIAL